MSGAGGRVVANEGEPKGAHGAVDYVLRTQQQNLMHLAALADQKASIVLGSAFVMATIVFGDVAGSSDLDAVRLLLLLTSTLSAIFAAIALAPRLSITGEARRQPLFFGAVARLESDDFLEVMRDLIGDRDRLYDAVLENLHASSVVLMRSKFRPLQISYAILVVGMVCTLVAALVS